MLTKIINKHHVKIVLFSTIVTLVGFALAIVADVESQELPISSAERRINTFGFTGILLLFAGFLITSLVQTYVLMHTHKKPIT